MMGMGVAIRFHLSDSIAILKLSPPLQYIIDIISIAQLVSISYSTMVVAIRQQTTEEQSSEMDTSQKQRKAAELAAAQSASLHEDPPLSSTTTRRGKRKDPRDLGTPPREDNVPPSIVSVDKEAPNSPSSLDKQNSRSRPQLPTRQQINNNNSSQQNPSHTTGLTPQPFTTSLKPGSGATTALPAPSFGEEDYKVLTSCIENMGSLDSVSDLLNSPDRPKEKKNKGTGKRGSHQYSSDKVEAASRAAAAVLSGDKKPTSSTHKDFHRQSTELHSNTTTHHNTYNTSNTTNTTTVQLPPTLNLENHGSAESIVVSSPSLGSHKGGAGTGNYKDDNSSSLSCSHSPASFMLDVSILFVLFVLCQVPFVR